MALDLNDVSRTENLNERILLKILLSNESTLRSLYIDDYNSKNSFQLNEENIFEFIDNEIEDYNEDFVENTYNFLESINVYDRKKDIYNISFNKSILSDLKPFCLTSKLIAESIAKKKAPTISNSALLDHLNVKSVLDIKTTFNQGSFEAQESMVLPSRKVDSEGIQFITSSPIKLHEELNGNEVIDGKIKLSLKKFPVISSDMFYSIDSNDKAIPLFYKDFICDKQNIIKSITKELSGNYIVSMLMEDDFPVEGRCILSHKIDYNKLNSFSKEANLIPSFDYSIDKAGLIKVTFDDNFINTFKNYINISKEMTFPYSTNLHSIESILINAKDSFDTVRDVVNSLRNKEDILYDLLHKVNKSELKLDPDNEVSYLNNLLFNLKISMEKELNSGNIEIDRDKFEETIDSINKYLANAENLIEYPNLQKTLSFMITELDLSNFFIDIPKIYKTSINVINSKTDYAYDKIFDFAYKANAGSLRNDRTHERRILENISKVNKEIGLNPYELLNSYLTEKINQHESLVNKLSGKLSGFDENLDFRDQNKIPIININEIPNKKIDTERLISYDLETGGLKATDCGLSQLTAYCVDFDKKGNVINRFFVDEYTNPEMNCLPVIGKTEDGLVFGSISESDDPKDTCFCYYKGDNDEYIGLNNENYHLFRTANPSQELFDSEKNKVLYLYPQQNLGAIETHGITNEFLVDKPNFRDILPGIKKLMDSADGIMGFNTKKFDNQFLVGLAAKNGLEFSIDPKKNIDLKEYVGNQHTYSEVKNISYNNFTNSNKLNLENNERYGGKTLNNLCTMLNTSLYLRYVSGTEVHDAKADVLITGCLAEKAYEISKVMLPKLKKLEKEFNLDKLSNIVDDDLSKDSEGLLVLKYSKKLEEIKRDVINDVSMNNELNLIDQNLNISALDEFLNIGKDIEKEEITQSKKTKKIKDDLEI